MQVEPIHPAVRVGHIHLRVADLDSSIAFYCNALGFNLTAEWQEIDTAFLAAGDYHHHIRLTAWPSAGGSPPQRRHTGLDHVAFLYPGRRELAKAVKRLLDQGHPIDHGTDHGASVSVYLADPHGNRIELYYDRPRAEWFDADGRPVLKTQRFDPNDLLHKPTT
jgi:catechol 2,3-dioxygenase